MRRRVAIALLAGSLAGASSPAPQPRSGLDVAGFDRTIAPQDDLYAHVNGAWLKRTAIPDDRVTYGAFAEIVDKTDRDLRQLIEETVARRDRPRGSPAQQIADLYTSMVDVAQIE